MRSVYQSIPSSSRHSVSGGGGGGIFRIVMRSVYQSIPICSRHSVPGVDVAAPNTFTVFNQLVSSHGTVLEWGGGGGRVSCQYVRSIPNSFLHCMSGGGGGEGVSVPNASNVTPILLVTVCHSKSFSFFFCFSRVVSRCMDAAMSGLGCVRSAVFR